MIFHSSKRFFQRFVIWLHTIIIPLYNCYDLTFCLWYFVYEKSKLSKQTNKQIKQWLDWLKDLSNTVKNTFYLIKLKLSEACGKKESFELRYYVTITMKISLKSQISLSFLEGNHMGNSLFSFWYSCSLISS